MFTSPLLRLSSLTALVALASFGCTTPEYEPQGTIEIVNPQNIGALQGITVSTFGQLYILGSEGIAALNEDGTLTDVADLAEVPRRADVFTDLFIVNDGSFALANSDEVARYYPESQTLEPFYCFVPGDIEDIRITLESEVLAVEPQLDARIAWGVQRTTYDDGVETELRGYSFGQSEFPAHVIEIPNDLEVRGLTFVEDKALLIDEDGALFSVDIERYELEPHSVQVDAQNVEGMTRFENTLFVLDANAGLVHKYKTDSLR